MSIYIANLRGELQKLFSHKKYYVFAILAMGICLISLGIKLLVMRVSGGNIDLRTQSMAMELQGFFLKIWIPFIIFLGASDLFGSEYQDSSIKALLGRPISRFKIYASKISAVYILAVVSLFEVFVVSEVLGLINGGISRLGIDFLAYILDCIPMLVLVLMATFINQFGKSSTFSMFLCIIVYIAAQVGGIFISNLSGLLFTGYLQWHSLFLGATIPVFVLIQRVALLLGYGLVFFSGGYYLFLSKEI